MKIKRSKKHLGPDIEGTESKGLKCGYTKNLKLKFYRPGVGLKVEWTKYWKRGWF